MREEQEQRRGRGREVARRQRVSRNTPYTTAADQSTLGRPPLVRRSSPTPTHGPRLQPRSPAPLDYRLRVGSPDIFRRGLFRSDFEFQCAPLVPPSSPGFLAPSIGTRSAGSHGFQKSSRRGSEIPLESRVQGLRVMFKEKTIILVQTRDKKNI